MAGPWYIVVGGSEVDIDATYGTKTSGMIGFGMPPLTHNIYKQPLIPGAELQSLKVEPRVLQLRIVCAGTTLAGYHSVRKDLLEAVKPNVGGTLAPVEIRYDGAGTKVRCYGYYDGGLEGDRGPGARTPETLVVRFICYDPFWYATTATTVSLTTQATIANADYIVRCNSGVWANISTDFADAVMDIIEDTAGNVYIGGQFDDVGTANGDGILKWVQSSTTLSALSTGLGAGGDCNALAAAPDGGVYLGGDFVDVGTAAGDRVIKWSGSAWVALGSGIDNGNVYALAVGHNGYLYAGGSFTNFVDANGDYITQWNGSAWSSMGTGVNGAVLKLAVGLDGTLYAAGAFTTAGGTGAVGIAKWTGSAWAAVGSGTGVAGGATQGLCLAVGSDGTLYLGGSFTSVDGIAANYIAKWNGTTWAPLGSGLNGVASDLSIGPDGLLYVTGEFTTAGGITLSDQAAIWNGSSWAHVPMDLPGTHNITAVLATDTDLYFGYNTAGTAYAAAQTTVTNGGTAVAYPTITIKRAGGTSARVDYLKNETTGQTLFLNYSLLDGETLTIALTQGAKSVTSDFFGSVIGRALLSNSDFATWCLQPGANVVSLYVNQAGSPTMTASCAFYAPHWSPDGVAS